jgi:hypothetical protein
MADEKKSTDDPYARDSFTLRRMTRGQVWSITIVAIVILVGLALYIAL